MYQQYPQAQSCIIYKQKRKPVFTNLQMVILALLFLMALNFKNKFYYLTFGAFGLLMVIQAATLNLHAVMLAPLILSICIAFFSPHAGASALTTIKIFSYPMCTLLGYNLVIGSTLEERERQLRLIFATLAAGSFSHYLLNMLHNWGSFDQRNTLDVWTGNVLSATGQAALACLMIGVASATVFTTDKKWLRTLYIGVLAVILYYNLVLAGRTIFVLVAVGLLTAFFSNYQNMKNASKKLRLLIGVAAAVVLVIWMIQSNAFNIQSVFAESNFFARFLEKNSTIGLLEDSRIEYKLEYLRRFLDHPWGGGHILNTIGHYAHDVFLDTYDDAGLIALIAVSCVVIGSIVKAVQIYRSPRVSGETRTTLLCVVFCIFLEFMVEPVLAGMPWLFACLCIIYGAQERVLALCEPDGGGL